jgi:hypothetical protein
MSQMHPALAALDYSCVELMYASTNETITFIKFLVNMSFIIPHFYPKLQIYLNRVIPEDEINQPP